jgi:transglutaminase-like putative cysteine protease
MKYFIIIGFLLALNSLASISPKDEANFRFTYRVEIPKPTKPFQKLQLWVPMASDNLEQKITAVKMTTPLHYQITEEKQYGNKILFADLNPKTEFPAVVVIEYKVHRLGAKAHILDDFKDQEHWKTADYLGVNQKIPITGEISMIAGAQTKGASSDDEKISRIYKYVTQTMTYNKDGIGWGQGDAIWACDHKRGNCTDFHSLFIGMARSQKIPARFEMGFPIPATQEGAIPGYHCWAWVYSAKKGWVPLDSSEAKQSGKMFEYLGYLPPDRIQFSNGRDIMLEPRQQSAKLNYFIYPHVEVDGRKTEVFKKEFSFKRL